LKRTAFRVGLALTLLSSSCIFGSSPRGAADELTQLAEKVSEATYAAVYRFNFTRQPAPGVATRLEIVQRPPTTVRKVESSTKREDGKTVAVKAWYVHNNQGDFACNEYEEVGVRCQRNPVARATFGSAKLDIFFDTPRTSQAFSEVVKDARTVRIGGHQATCFEGIPASPSPSRSLAPSGSAAASPAATAERYRYELCYASDGILLRGRRTTLDDGGPASNAESFVEVASLSRVVEPSELELPGPVVDPGDL
jgi:hypothetical protein